jgi:hypothetical protein
MKTTRKRSFYSSIVVLIAGLTIASCSTSTSITGSWTRQDHEPQQFNTIVILGIAQNSQNRRIFEDQVASRLEEKGYPVIPALDLLPPDAAIGTITKDIVVEIFNSAAVDAVFTMSLRHEEDTRHYVPGRSTYYVPYYRGMGFPGYYGGFSNYYYTPGYYAGSYKIYLEANFFDYKKGELIWSAQTRTTNIEDVNKLAREFADVIVEDFTQEEVVRAPAVIEE